MRGALSFFFLFFPLLFFRTISHDIYCSTFWGESVVYHNLGLSIVWNFEMGTPSLQQLLRRTLCFNPHWKYAVFWKLKYLPRMGNVLTWEDAWLNEFHSDESSLLRSAMSSYRVYSLGEGTVGQVAASGQHAWTFSYHHAADSSSSSLSQYCGEWEAQFSAGIKTIAVVGIVPYGVVQLGSEYDIVEDFNFVHHVRGAFYELMDRQNSCYLSATSSQSAMEDCLEIFTRFLHEDDPNLFTWLFEPPEHQGTSCFSPALQDHELLMTMNSDHTETEISPFSFSNGSELYEALGPSFRMNNGWKAEVSYGIGSFSPLRDDSPPDMQLLDAVVAKISRKCDESHLNAERTPCTTTSSSGLNSLASVVEVLKGLSPTSSSRESENRDGLVKGNKKRARPGESCRPRPRDRQLIQDRIKELRELVPHGSKCSIDSLLEKTIKHMIYMQSITKHAEKLKQCSTSKFLSKEMHIQSFPSGEEQGSTWALQVGNQNISRIMVENINMDGDMLVEMLCEECNHFLLIADAIRRLHLTILKGISAACGNKTWFSFVVEPQNNESIHRMDVLWSLMQLLQNTTSAEC